MGGTSAILWHLATTDLEIDTSISGGGVPDAQPPKTFDAPLEALTADDDVAVIVARPLFVHSRLPPQPRPEPVVVETPAEVAPQPAPEPETTPEFSLVGVRIDTDGRQALIRIGDAGATNWKSQGDELEGWKIDAISESGVTLKRNDRTLSLTLYRGNTQSEP